MEEESNGKKCIYVGLCSCGRKSNSVDVDFGDAGMSDAFIAKMTAKKCKKKCGKRGYSFKWKRRCNGEEETVNVEDEFGEKEEDAHELRGSGSIEVCMIWHLTSRALGFALLRDLIPLSPSLATNRSQA